MATGAPTWSVGMVTGHRPQHLDPRSLVWIDNELRRIVWKLRYEHGATTLLSGMAAGVDLMWAERVYQLGASLAAHVPFPQQPDPWTDGALVDRYHELLTYADQTGGIRVYGDLPAGPSKPETRRRAAKLLFARNDGMLTDTAAAAGVVVAVLRSAHVGGGTRSCYDKALDLKLPVIRVDPDRQVTVMASAGRGTVKLARRAGIPVQEYGKHTTQQEQETLPI
jgi:hypothetical protein